MAYRSGTTTTDGNGTSSVITVPTGAASGDIAVVTIYLESNAAITPPSGFTQKADIDSANAATHGRIIIFWKRLTAADTGSYTFSWTGSTWAQGACVLYSGRSTSGDPFEATNTLVAATDTTPDVPGVTATSNADLFCAISQFATASTWTAPTGMTTRTSTAGQGVIATATQDAVTAGATGTKTWTLNASGFAHGFLGSLHIAGGGATTDTASVGGTAWGGVVAASAAGVIGLTSLGGLAWSGVRANSTAGVNITDTTRVGSASWAGVRAQSAADALHTTRLGSLSWSGVRAQSAADVTHQARVGSLALGGLAPVLSIEDVVDGTGPGAFAWSGVRAQSTAVGGGVADSARVGSAAWSGVPAVSAADVIATGRVGGVTWVGVKAASVADLTNPAHPAALTWSGITANSTTALVQVDTARVGIIGWTGVPASSATTILHQTRVGELAWGGVRASSVASATPTRDVTVTLIRDRSRLVSVTDRSRTVAVRSRS